MPSFHNGLTNIAGNQSHIESSEDIQPVNPFDILARSNIMVIWLDEHIGRDENCRALKMEFRQLTNNLKMVDSVNSCRQCLPPAAPTLISNRWSNDES
ncbi:unnamed protein product [Rotaria sordida]|uniref:Uncharacterized protein n=1 Tax=Rotaria sordida TaxID=392033 RepID=A0A814QLF6_9BILA|nr:unnamed protein product [Rotaria sordida]